MLCCHAFDRPLLYSLYHRVLLLFSNLYLTDILLFALLHWRVETSHLHIFPLLLNLSSIDISLL